MAAGLYIATIAIAFIAYAAFSILPFLKRTWRSTRAMKQFPKEEYHWLLGHLATHPGPNHEGLMLSAEWVAKHPRYFVFFFGPLRPVLALNHPETIQQLARTAEPKAFSGGGSYNLLRPWIGDGLLLSSGNKWFRNRRLLTPGFHFDILKPYVGVYNSCVERLMDIFEKQSVHTNKSIDICRPVSLCTLDIILRCAFSTEKNVQFEGENEPYVKTVVSLSSLIVERAMRPYLYINTLYSNTRKGREFKEKCDISHNYAKSVIKKRQHALQNHKIGSQRYVDFLDILLLARDDSGNGLSDTEIRDEVETFMFEGHDTTSSAISWILYNLATHTEIQAKARDEVDALLNSRDNDSILWEDLKELPYVTMCMKESMRLHPPVPFVSRELSKPFAIDGKVLPVGSFVDIAIWCVHHNPNVWHDPFIYNPERFLLDNLKYMHSHAFIPFSAGPRNCIGQNFAMHEIKVAIARILRRFEFTLDDSKEVRMKFEIVLRAENGIHINFKTRNI